MKRKCEKGKPCGATCIERSDICRKDLSLIGRDLSQFKDLYSKAKLRQKERRNKYKETKRTILGNMAYMAMLGRKGSYDIWEEKLLNLQNKAGKKWKDFDTVKKGEVWKDNFNIREKERLGRWDKAYKSLVSRMDTASREGKRGTYLKLEKGLLKLLGKAPEGSLTNPIPSDIAKGLIWASGTSQRRDNRANQALVLGDKIRSKMRDAAGGGDRGNYLKLQRKLFLLDKEYHRLKGGISPFKDESIWKTARAEVSERRFRDALLKTARDGNKGAFNRLIERHSKVSKGYDKEMWEGYRRLASLVDKLQSSDLLRKGKFNTSLRHEFYKDMFGEYRQEIIISSKVLGNNLDIKITPKSFDFTVNGSYMARNLPKSEAITIGREIKRQFSEVIKSLDEGRTIAVTAARGEDKKVGARKRAYIKAGFYDPVSDSHDSLFGVVKGGRIRPIEEEEFFAKKQDLF